MAKGGVWKARHTTSPRQECTVTQVRDRASAQEQDINKHMQFAHDVGFHADMDSGKDSSPQVVG